MRTSQLTIIAMMSALLLSCGGTGSSETVTGDVDTTTNAVATESVVDTVGYKDAEIAYIDQNGKLYFYFPESGTTKPFVEEKEPIFNCVFDNTSDIMYYTVLRDDILWLKKVFYEPVPATITTIGSTKVSREACYDKTCGCVSRLMFTRSETVLLPYDYASEAVDFRMKAVYETLVGLTGDESIKRQDILDDDEYYDYDRDIVEAGISMPHETVNNDLIFEGANLTSTLHLQPEASIGEVDFGRFQLSPDGSKLAFKAITKLDNRPHGPLCLANVDGSNQQILLNDNCNRFNTAVWIGNQLLFMQNDKLRLTNADNSISDVASKVSFYAARQKL